MPNIPLSVQICLIYPNYLQKKKKKKKKNDFPKSSFITF